MRPSGAVPSGSSSETENEMSEAPQSRMIDHTYDATRRGAPLLSRENQVPTELAIEERMSYDLTI